MSLKKIISLLFSVITWFSISILSVLAVYTLTSNISIFRGYKSYLVQSGSMEPNIHIGDVVIVQNRSIYYPHDIITFSSADAQGRLVTHRIVSNLNNQDTAYFTKGDANRDQDESEVNIADIVGKVVLIIPKLGWLVTFSRTIPGLTILIFLPTVGIIFDSLVNLSAKRKNVE